MDLHNSSQADNGNRRFVRAARGGQDEAALPRAISRAKEGDADALSYLYVRFADDVFGYVNSIVRDTHEAEDITQSVFAKLLRAIRRYEPREVPFKAWLLRVARNAALDHVRARRLVPREEVYGADAGHQQVGFDRSQCLRAALEQLPHDQRQVLGLRHISGLSPREIATVLGKTESSIHGLHTRGRATLRAALEELEAAPVTAAPVTA